MKLLRAAVPTAILLLSTSGAISTGAPRQGTVTIVHGLPGFTADVYVDGELLLDGFRPTQAAGPLKLAAGTYEVAIRELGAPADSPPVLSGSVRLKPGANISIVAHLTPQGNETVSIFRNVIDRLPAGESYLLVRDVSVGPHLRIRLDGRTVIPGLGPGAERGVSVDPGRYELAVVARGSGERLIPATAIRLEEGVAQIVYVIGSTETDSLALMYQAVRGSRSIPRGILSGDGGLAADPGFPLWAAALTAVGVAAIAGSTRALLRRR